MKFDYNYFSKEELVSFLNKNDKNYMYIEKPHTLILKQREETINRKIGLLLEENKILIKNLKDKDMSIDKIIDIMSRLEKNHKLYKKYSDEQERIFEKMYR